MSDCRRVVASGARLKGVVNPFIVSVACPLGHRCSRRVGGDPKTALSAIPY
ncbi:MAG: hypothetical protein SWZ49_21220 [Cyanobacteriota bacterium]|nr:hypothetical protein [Cyanobacteriota bacterium]